MTQVKTEEHDFTLTLAGFEWRVLFIDDLKAEGGYPLCGLSDPDSWQILLRRGMIRQLRQSTFWHEVLHAIVCPITSHERRVYAGYVCEEHAAELFGRGMVELITQKHLLPSWVFSEPPKKVKK